MKIEKTHFSILLCTICLAQDSQLMAFAANAFKAAYLRISCFCPSVSGSLTYVSYAKPQLGQDSVPAMRELSEIVIPTIRGTVIKHIRYML